MTPETLWPLLQILFIVSLPVTCPLVVVVIVGAGMLLVRHAFPRFRLTAWITLVIVVLFVLGVVWVSVGAARRNPPGSIPFGELVLGLALILEIVAMIRLIEWPTRRYLGHVLRLTPAQFASTYPQKDWARAAYPIVMFIWIVFVWPLTSILVMLIFTPQLDALRTNALSVYAGIPLFMVGFTGAIAGGLGLFEIFTLVSATRQENGFPWHRPTFYLHSLDVANAGRARLMLGGAMIAISFIVFFALLTLSQPWANH